MFLEAMFTDITYKDELVHEFRKAFSNAKYKIKVIEKENKFIES